MAIDISKALKFALLLGAGLLAIFLYAQVPNPPSGVGASTATITVMVGGQSVGSAPVLNFTSGNGTVVHCAPNLALNSIDCNSTADSAAFLSPAADQSFQDHVFPGVSGSPTCQGKQYAGQTTPNNGGIVATGSVWIMLPDCTTQANASLDLSGGGLHPLEKLSAGALVQTTGGECVAGIPCVLIAVGSPVNAFLIH